MCGHVIPFAYCMLAEVLGAASSNSSVMVATSTFGWQWQNVVICAISMSHGSSWLDQTKPYHTGPDGRVYALK